MADPNPTATTSEGEKPETPEGGDLGKKNVKTVFHWPPLESDPEILTNYMHKIGMSKEWQLHEIFGLEPALLAFVPQPAVACVAAIQRDRSK